MKNCKSTPAFYFAKGCIYKTYNLIGIDGRFCLAYQKKTGIAGYTLVYNSWGLLLATHHRILESGTDNLAVSDIDCTTEILESRDQRIQIRHTDLGLKIIGRFEELTALYDSYRKGLLAQRSK